MSGFVGGALPTRIVTAKDNRLEVNIRIIYNERDRVADRYSATEMPGGYVTSFWPGGLGMVGAQGTDVGVAKAIWGRVLSRIGQGAGSRVGFRGITRDYAGGLLGGVTCSLFLTSTRAWIMDVVSDANGEFLLQSWFSPGAHFIVFNKAGSPNVYGATDNNLTGG